MGIGTSPGPETLKEIQLAIKEIMVKLKEISDKLEKATGISLKV